jgi:hypothetical protein
MGELIGSNSQESNMDGLNSDKVNINLGGGEGGGGMQAAAMVAALGNRNQGDNTAALIAALGNRNDGHRNDDGFGMGGGGILGTIALLGLLRGRGGLGGGDEGCGESSLGREFLMSKLGSIEGAIPLAAANVENGVCRAEATITNAVNQSQLATLAAASNLKDAVTNSATILLGAGSQNTKEILGAICALGSKIDANQILDLQRQLGVAQADAREERGHRHSDGVEVRVSQQVTQAQAQQQLQAQSQKLDDERFAHLFALINNVGNTVQRIKSDNETINFGTMLASANQANTQSAVR